MRSGKLLGFMVSQNEIEVDLEKAYAILEMPMPCTEKKVQNFLRILNYIAISQLMTNYDPLFKLLCKNQTME